MEQEIATQVVGLGGVNDFSLWQLFLRADFVVKSVIVILLASSIWSWALIFDKYKLFKKINESSTQFENKFWKSKSAESFSKTLPAKSDDPITQIFISAMNEVIKTRSKSSAIQSARVERVLEVSIDNQLKSVEKNLEGKNAVILGRSNLNGKPMAQLLLKENCTVTILHSKTKDLKTECKRADILIAAVGVKEIVKGDWIKKDAIVIDVGINKVNGKIVGDVDFESSKNVAKAITPVPGGVGPMTIACLLKNTLECFKKSNS